MEQQIKRAVRSLNLNYVLFWSLPVFIFIIGEYECLPVGCWADDTYYSYFLETFGILITAIGVPLALKLFSVVLHRKIDQLTISLAIRRYVQWNFIRLAILEIVIVFNLLGYYLTLNQTGHLCALIALTASLFCFPSECRLRSELQIDIDDKSLEDK